VRAINGIAKCHISPLINDLGSLPGVGLSDAFCLRRRGRPESQGRPRGEVPLPYEEPTPATVSAGVGRKPLAVSSLFSTKGFTENETVQRAKPFLRIVEPSTTRTWTHFPGRACLEKMDTNSGGFDVV
jgi:hypothetical protein